MTTRRKISAMRAAAWASTAAPTLFEPALVRSVTGEEHLFVDGGVFANNPAGCAFAEIERRHSAPMWW